MQLIDCDWLIVDRMDQNSSLDRFQSTVDDSKVPPFLVCQPMDQSSLKNSDVLILTGLTQMPTANPDGMLGEFCSNLGKLDLGLLMVTWVRVASHWWLCLLPICACSHDDSSRRQCACAMLLLWCDIRPAGVSVPVHRERQPGDHALLLHLTRRQQLAGILPDLRWVVRTFLLSFCVRGNIISLTVADFVIKMLWYLCWFDGLI